MVCHYIYKYACKSRNKHYRENDNHRDKSLVTLGLLLIGNVVITLSCRHLLLYVWILVVRLRRFTLQGRNILRLSRRIRLLNRRLRRLLLRRSSVELLIALIIRIIIVYGI